MRRIRAALITSLNSQKVLPARSWPAPELAVRDKLDADTLTDQEGLSPRQSEFLPLEPQAVHHCCARSEEGPNLFRCG